MLNQFRAQKLEWNRANNQIYDRVEANSGDSNGRTLFVQISNDGMVEDLTGATLSLAWSKRAEQGLEAFEEVDAKKGEFRLFYPTGMLVNHGVLRASLVLVDVTGRIESKPFDIIVHKGTVDDEAVESDNKFTALTTALVKVSQVQAEFDSLYGEKSQMMDTLHDDKKADMEVLEADYSNRANTLEATYAPRLTEVSAQLAQKAEEDEVFLKNNGININDFDEPTRQAFLTAQGVDVNYVLGKKNVKPENATFFKVGKNLFDKTKALLGFSVSSTTGATSAYAARFVTDWIEIKENTDYAKFPNAGIVAFYDLDKVFISGTDTTSAAFKTPVGAKYVRCAMPIENIDTAQIEKGLLRTTYEPFYEYIPLEYQERKEVETADIKDEAVTPEKTNFFTIGKNLFDKTKVTPGSVSSSNGAVVTVQGRVTSDYIEVESNTEYTRSHSAYTVAFYDSSKTFISGIPAGSGLYTFTTPNGAFYMRASFTEADINEVQIEKGSTRTPYEPFSICLKGEHLKLDSSHYEHKFALEFETVRQKTGLTGQQNSNSSLSLIGLKQHQSGTNAPDVIGYLYLNMAENKLYYSDIIPDNPVYLTDWDMGISNNTPCQNYTCTITNDGDLIFIRYNHREDPIIYPANNYGNPKRIQLGSIKPFSFLNNTGCAISHDKDFFIFGDYPPHSLEAEQLNHRRYIWKVSKPYDNPENWRTVHDFKHVYFGSPPSDEPDNEIGHIHTITRDHFTGAYYATTGDIDRHCRTMRSLDEGETWVEMTSGSQIWRNLGWIFTEDYAYWGTDSHRSAHEFYRVGRNDLDGEIDFSKLEFITKLDDFYYPSTDTQPTYATILLRNPNGLLFLDRAENRADGLLDVMFYSFEYEELFNAGTFKVADDFVPDGGYTRHGFPNQVATSYQPTTTDYIMCGGGDYIRHNGMDVLGHSEQDYIGNLKIRVKQLY